MVARKASSDGVLHLDTAGSSRPAPGTLDAQIGHLRREAEIGGYAAEVEAAPVVAAGRRRLGELLGVGDDEVAWAASATDAFARLLSAWPLGAGSRVAVAPFEYGSNRMALDALAARAGVELVLLPVDRNRRLDLDGLAAALRGGLDLVTFPHLASHRGVVHPAAEAARLCREAGVPLLLDVAQSAGHLPLDGIGADACVGTSRKWLRGSRGVGYLAVRSAWLDRLTPPLPGLYTADWGDPPDLVGSAARLGLGGESPVAARVGLASALRDLDVTADAPRIAEAGRLLRARLHGVAGWEAEEPLDEPCGIVTLAHDRLDPVTVQRRLLAEQHVVTVAIVTRQAKGDLARPVLRFSPPPETTGDDVERAAAALAAASS